jgi:cytochrome P450
MRRLLSYAFSEQALRTQEDIVTSYIDLMISKLRSRAAAGTPVDIMRYFNFTTFDITGDLTFGESFGSLVSEDYDHWIANIFRVIRLVCVIQVMRCYGLAAHKLFKVIPALAKGMEEHKKYTEDKMTRRLENPTDRKDFMRYDIHTAPHCTRSLADSSQLRLTPESHHSLV